MRHDVANRHGVLFLKDQFDSGNTDLPTLRMDASHKGCITDE